MGSIEAAIAQCNLLQSRLEKGYHKSIVATKKGDLPDKNLRNDYSLSML